ncbi:hypothetical protein C8A00DRAFT_14294 [Chaetomidium leptoderma]|uniref:Uncharacterized protein n=1 Tax=Chaetomidium leptoderma TaxID=669021 RepID=A0AAN6VNV2_9PEZI|nr:hypothetical protein C8A00DRAFT_14294 [Chaetomidium leptoderma]
MDGGESNDDLPGNEDDENHDMGDNDSVGGVSTVNEPADHEPLEAGACWDAVPDRKKILRLAEIWGSKDLNGGYETLLQPTARDVVFTAMASVQFLEDIGEDAIDQSKIGIDRAGGLIKLKSPRTKDFRKDFSDMVSELARELGLRKPREAIKQKMKAYIRANEEAPLPKGRCLLIKHRDLEAMLCLRELVLDTFFGWLSGINNLHSVLDQCEEAVSELKSIISPITAVRQDLVDKGTSDRWDDMRKTMPPVRLTAEAKEMRQNNNVDGLIGTMTSDLMPYQSVLERTIKLGDDLRAAIEEFAPLSEPVTSREERLQNQVLMAPLPPDIFAMWDPEEEDGQRVWDDGRGTRSPGWYTDEESE